MNSATKFLLTSLIACLSIFALAQGSVSIPGQGEPTTTFTGKMLDAELHAGESSQVIITAEMREGYHIFGTAIKGDWISTQITLLDGKDVLEQEGDQIEMAGKLVIVPGFKTPGVWWEKAVNFALPVRVPEGTAPGEYTVTVNAFSQACNDTTCDMPTNYEIPVTLTVVPGSARVEMTSANTDMPAPPSGYVEPDEAFSSLNTEALEKAKTGELFKSGASSGSGAAVDDEGTVQKINEAKSHGILFFFLVSFGAGLLALLTPCVWPMIPITVSYFSKKTDEGRKTNLAHAIAYSLGIIITFVGLGLIMSLVAGAAGPQALASNLYVNLFLAVLFFVLAINLFGYFEIIVPSKFVNAVQKKATGSAGFIAPILLGFVFSLTTFTCTVPFVGTILFSATQGNLLYPIVGMSGFALAFALPFFLLALVPQWASSLPKSGGWLNVVKGFMGFVEIAAGLKFLSNAELVLGLGVLTFPVYMAIYAAIFVIAAIYLFGKLQIPNQSTPVGTGRKIFAWANVALALFFLNSINSPTSLGSLLAFTPPTRYPGHSETNAKLPWVMDYDQALSLAQSQGKPLFLNFTGVTCGNCRIMEERFESNPEYNKRLQRFVVAELYTDRQNVPDDAKRVKLREELTKSSTNPAYVILTPEGEVISVFQGLALKDEDFFKFLDGGFTDAGGTSEAEE